MKSDKIYVKNKSCNEDFLVRIKFLNFVSDDVLLFDKRKVSNCIINIATKFDTIRHV